MKKNNAIFAAISVFSVLTFLTSKTFAIDYTISFSGSGAGTVVDSVIVQNLTRNTSVKIPAGYVLNLTDVTAVEQIETDNEMFSIIPNPVTDISTVSFFAKKAGLTRVNVTGLDGKILTEINCNLSEGINSFQISLSNGAYILRISGNGYAYSSKVISCSGFKNKPMVSFTGNEIKTNSNAQKSKNSNVILMTYYTGNQLLYKGYSGNNCTIVTDKPTESKTTDFKFVDCTDADGNHYEVVHIGTQTWMAQNLRTTKYRNNESIGTTTGAINDVETSKYQWVYNDNESNAAKFGRLYTWYAATDSRNIAPAGWHLATDTEWRTLQYYLIDNGYNFDGSTTSGNKIAKALAATTDWISDTWQGAIGNDLTKNNSSGFSALPGGNRYFDGTFYSMGSNGHWWTSTDNAWERNLYYNENYLNNYNNKRSYGFSVRCVKD